MPETIIQQDAAVSHKNSMGNYAIEVNLRRSTPDAKDGLKLVHRRILDVMFNDEPCAEKLVKTSAVVGTTMKKSHPHGDASIGDAIKPMVNWWEIGIPLIDTRSNYGNFHGKGAAAPRYTEIKLSQFCLDCVIGDLRKSKNIVDWVDTFDYRDKEPEYFPVKVPLLLINGTFGIGVGIKTEIPKHPINEVIDATLRVIEDPSAPVVLVPDTCMPCEIVEANWKKICNTGHGKYKVRGIIDIEQNKDGSYSLIIKSVPDRVYFDRGNAENGGVKYVILKMVEEKKLPQIMSIDIDSKGTDMRIIIRLRKGADPNFVRDMIYKNTQMESPYSVNFETLDGIKPLRMSYKSYIEFFIEQAKTNKFRLYANKLQKANTRYHKITSYIEILKSDKLQEMLKVMQTMKEINDKALMEKLIKKFGISDIQAEFLINSTYKTSSIAYRLSYEKEAKALEEDIKHFIDMITIDELIIQEIVDELKYFKKKYGQPRRSKVIKIKDLSHIPEGQFNIVITEAGFVRKLSPFDAVNNIKGDAPKHVMTVENTENILLFTASGKVFNVPIHKIPVTEKSGVGTDLRLLVKGLVSDIVEIMYLPMVKERANDAKNKYFIMTLTEGNCIKKMDLDDFLNVPPSGILFTKINSGDRVIDVKIVSKDSDIIVWSDRKALRMRAEAVPHFRRNALGVGAMSGKEHIDGFTEVRKDITDVLVVTNSGRVNRFDIIGLPLSDRYKAGSNVVKLGKTDNIHSILCCNSNDMLLVTSKVGDTEYPVGSIKTGSSISAGEKVIPLKNDVILKTKILSNPN